MWNNGRKKSETSVGITLVEWWITVQVSILNFMILILKEKQ